VSVPSERGGLVTLSYVAALLWASGCARRLPPEPALPVVRLVPAGPAREPAPVRAVAVRFVAPAAVLASWSACATSASPARMSLW
jgi:hypothetical protein